MHIFAIYLEAALSIPLPRRNIMWIDPQVLEHDLLRLLAFVRKNPNECPNVIRVLEERIDEIREWQRDRALKKKAS